MSIAAGMAHPNWREWARVALLWVLAGVVSVAALTYERRYPLRQNSTLLTDLGKLSSFSHPAFWQFLLAGLAITIAMVLAALLARGMGRRALWPVLAGCAFAGTALVFTYPASAIDVFIYAARSRLFTEYGENPLIAHPNDFLASDPYMRFASQEWGSHGSPYGPLWNLIAAPATLIGGSSITTALFMFKAIAVIFWLGCGALIWRITERLRPGDGIAAAILFLWNPIVLWEGIANAHNDLVMMFFILAAAWAYVAERDEGIVPLLVIAVLVKYAALVLLPIAAIAALRRQPNRDRMLRLIGWWAIWSIGLAFVSLAPFFDVGAIRTSIDDQTSLLLTSPGSLIYDELRTAGHPASIYDTIRQGGQIVAVIGIGIMILLTLWKPRHQFRFQHEAMLILLLAGTPALRPWYAIWIVALAGLLPIGWPTVRAIAYGLGAYLTYCFSIWVWNWSGGPWIIMMRCIVWSMVGPAIFFAIVEGVAELYKWDRRRQLRRRSGFGSQWENLAPRRSPESGARKLQETASSRQRTLT
jgi:hypothetical protein